MSVLTVQQIYQAARAAGFSPQQAVTWTAIAQAESRGNLNALNNHGEYSVGLWQINIRPGVRTNIWGDLTDPAVNARAAYSVSHQGRDMRPWTTTHDSNKGTAADYRTYLPAIEKQIGVQGDDRGVHGYGATLPPPLPEHSYDRIGHGADVATSSGAGGAERAGSTTRSAHPGQDADGDGLADDFERLVGTDPHRDDTDLDGLKDGYEATVSHTDPLSADTDGDHLGDKAELAAGTDPGRLPGVGGVVGSGALAENVRAAPDRDHDGISDRTEKLVGTDSRALDSDKDQVADAVEVALGTDPTRADSNADGITDGWANRLGLDPLAGSGPGAAPVPRWTLESALAARAAGSSAAAAGDPAAAGGSAAVGDPSVGAGAKTVPAVGGAGSSSPLARFLRVAEAQNHDRYVYGAPKQLGNKNPETFDCSSLTQWAAHQAGVELPRTAEEQYRELHKDGLTMDVDKALQTPGALLFYFSSPPTGALAPGNAHVAISLGNGKVFEARGSRWGVGEWSAKGHGFNYAAVIPGISDPAGQHAYEQLAADATAASSSAGAGGPAADAYAIDGGRALAAGGFGGAGPEDPDSDGDGLTDAFEKLAGTDPDRPDTDGDSLTDGYEATVSHTDPLRVDTDADGVADGDEVGGGSDAGRVPGRAYVSGTGAAAQNIRHGKHDRDHDGLSDRAERALGTDPDQSDTDGDKLADGAEVDRGTDPLDVDTNHDGRSDWWAAQPDDASVVGGGPDGTGGGHLGSAPGTAGAGGVTGSAPDPGADGGLGGSPAHGDASEILHLG